MKDKESDELLVIVSETGIVRGSGASKLKVEDLAANVTLFLKQMSQILEGSPDKMGNFQFTEFEVNAEINAKGSLALLGVGGEAGAKGGIKFIFRRT